MKEHFLTKIEDGSNSYTTFKNPNDVLKRKISEFKIDQNSVKIGWPRTEWNIVEWESEEVKCMNGRNVSYFPKEKVIDALKEQLEYERNQSFKPHDHFKEAFGVISSYSENGDYAHLLKLDLKGDIPFVGLDTDKTLDPLRVNFYTTFYDYSLSTYEGIKLECGESGRSLSLYFNEDGNYVNRDYNLDMVNFECKDISPEIIMKKFEAMILKAKNLKRSKNIFYNDEFCYVPYSYDERGDHVLGVEIVPARDEKSYQMHSGRTIYKKPKTLVECTSSDLLNEVKGLMTDQFKSLFNVNSTSNA